MHVQFQYYKLVTSDRLPMSTSAAFSQEHPQWPSNVRKISSTVMDMVRRPADA